MQRLPELNYTGKVLSYSYSLEPSKNCWRTPLAHDDSMISSCPPSPIMVRSLFQKLMQNTLTGTSFTNTLRIMSWY